MSQEAPSQGYTPHKYKEYYGHCFLILASLTNHTSTRLSQDSKLWQSVMERTEDDRPLRLLLNGTFRQYAHTKVDAETGHSTYYGDLERIINDAAFIPKCIVRASAESRETRSTFRPPWGDTAPTYSMQPRFANDSSIRHFEARLLGDLHFAPQQANHRGLPAGYEEAILDIAYPDPACGFGVAYTVVADYEYIF